MTNAPLNLRTLGGLGLVGASFTQPKPLLLLAYLALEGPQPRRRLAELFWPQGAGRKSLSMTLTRLRGAVGDALCADEGRVWTMLESDAGALVQALNRGVKQGDADVETLAAAYPGAFLDGLDLTLAEELEEWVYRTRERLGERVQGVLLEGAEVAAQGGGYADAARLAERAYRLPGAPPPEPETLERLYRLLAAGRSLLAPAVRAELAEYGVAVSLTPEAARALLHPAPPDAPPNIPPDTRPDPLPTRATSFVGREAELAELGRAFARPACRLVTLLGPAGVGKTRLALRFAHDRLGAARYPDGRYPDGVVFVALEVLQDANFVPELARQLARQLGQGPGAVPGDADDPVAQLGAFLAPKRLLVVLDNFEHLTASAPVLSRLLQGAPGLELLVTTRVRLRLEEEHLVPLGGLSYPERGVTPGEAGYEVARYEAVRLFAERARQLRADFSLTGELEAVLELCRLLGGLPLGLELAAGWVRVMACADIVQAIQGDLDVLASTDPGRVERHRSLRAAFTTSWRLLAAQERAALARLAVFPADFSREAAAAVAGATLPLLLSLVDRSLVQAQGGRFDLHPLVLQYAGEALAADPEAAAEARAAHAAFYLDLAAEQRAASGRGQQEAALGVLGREWENVRAVFGYLLDEGAAASDLGLLVGWLELFELLYDMRGSYAEAAAFLARAEAVAAQHGASAVRGCVQIERAWFELRLGRYDRAEAAARAALAGPLTERWRVSGLNVLGILERRTGDYAAARAACEAGLGLARDYRDLSGDDLLTAKLLATLADVLEVQGDLAAAETHLLEAVALYRQHGQVLGLVRNLNNLGWLYYVGGRTAEAKAALGEGLRHARAVGFRQTIPYLLNNLGYLALDAGQVAEARVLNEEALEFAKASGERALQAEVLISLARTALASARRAEARRYADEALGLAYSVPYVTLVLGALLVRGELALGWDPLESTCRHASLSIL